MLECVLFGSVCVCHAELLAVQKQYEESLSLVRTEADGRCQREIESIKLQCEEEVESMRASLSEKTSLLLGVQAELESMKSMVGEREEALHSTALDVEGMRQQLSMCQVELGEVKQQKDKLQSVIEHLKVSHFAPPPPLGFLMFVSPCDHEIASMPPCA